MTSLVTSIAERNRQTNAVNLTARHLAERQAKHVTARRLADGLLVWSVASQTRPGVVHTVTRICDGWPADSCSCEDSVNRHMECKHRRAVSLLSPPPEPAEEWQPAGGWLSDRKVKGEIEEGDDDILSY